MLSPDDGYYFGLGAFETIAVEDGKPQFLSWHYERLFSALDFFHLSVSKEEIQSKTAQELTKEELRHGRKALKITVSEKNITFSVRDNPYHRADYDQGFLTDFSKVRRNETSPLTYHKTLNYGDCILEKRLAKTEGIHEPIFLNTRGEIAEGATTNVFFIKDGCMIAPPLTSGMLPGIVRRYIYTNYSVQELVITPRDIQQYDEMFVTNSLLGIMPVRKLGQHSFSSMEHGLALAKAFFATES